MEGARGVRVKHRIFLDLFVGRQANDGFGASPCARPGSARETIGARHVRPFGFWYCCVAGTGGGIGVRIGMRFRPARAVSSSVESMTDHSSEGSQPRGTMKAVPRRLRMASLICSPAWPADGQFRPRPARHCQTPACRLWIRQHGTAHLVRPIVVMGNAAQAGFDPPINHRRCRDRPRGSAGL
jgi:hypothetical protein